MTTVTITLPDQQAAALKAKATAQGLTLESWLQKIAEREAPASQSERARAAADRIREIQKRTKPDPEGWTIRDYINYGRR
jgi:hypothetical protein